MFLYIRPHAIYFERASIFIEKHNAGLASVRSLRVISASEATTCHKRKRDAVMAEELEKVGKIVEQSMENARGPIDRPFEIFQKTIGMNPWGGTALVDQMQRFAVKKRSR